MSVSAFTAARTATAPRGDATRAFGEARAERALRAAEPFARDVNDIAAREAAAAETSAEEAPVEDAPAEEAPVEDAPAEETPIKEAAAEDEEKKEK